MVVVLETNDNDLNFALSRRTFNAPQHFFSKCTFQRRAQTENSQNCLNITKMATISSDNCS